jgi:hypothetical protein
MELEMKTLIATALLLAAGSATAHNSCNLDLDAGVHISSDSIEFYVAEQPTYKIIDDQYLVVKGQAQKLTLAQQKLVASYAASIRAALPEVRGMALDGIDLAIEGITLAFDGLLGEKNQISAQLATELTNLKSDVNRYFSSGNLISFNRGDEGAPDFLGKQFETRIERIVETSVQNSVGSLMFAMGKEALMSGGSMEGFEARMNKFGEQMAEQISTKAAGMEARGAKLCSAMQAIDALEEQLKQAVPAVESFNIIRVNADEIEIAQHTI